MDPPGEVLEDEYMLANTSNHARPTENIHVVSTLNKEQRYNTRFDPCYTRCCMECGSSYPGWFSIQEGDQTLDIPASFAPTSWQARGTKFVMMVWFNGTLVYHWWVSYADHAAFFLSYLTHWGLIFASLWLIVTFCNSLYPPAQPNGRDTTVKATTQDTLSI
ncbi:expressed unknown protein [Seminavis robusta]|uniref:Uncharacterized protein n=1 Tax=Seminavis robusta TaxID=568900 RepID=A0A9N8D8F9_9STRA|nr:expressed unknown protein [Seminavis robusta]|eukprot:Sro36_g022800.1 n/a (162) ;mRNA; f:66327-66812